MPLHIALGALAGGAAMLNEMFKGAPDPIVAPIDPENYKLQRLTDPVTGQPIDFGQQAFGAQGRTSAQMGINGGQNQNQIINLIKARARGEAGPSAAELQMKAGQERALQGARSLAVSQQGVSPAMALRSAQEAGTQAAMNTNQQSAILRAQEQAQAMQTGAQIEFGTMQENLKADLQQRAMNDQMTKFYLQQGFAENQAQLMANMAMNELVVEQAMALNGIQMQSHSSDKAALGQLFGSLTQAAGQIFSGAGAAVTKASDRRLKKDIKRSKKELDELMNGLKAYSYEYKDEKFGKGEHTSVMAQDLERSELGKYFVEDTPEGKIVDYGKGLGTMLASVARLNERLSKIEKKGEK